jgi:RHS repeat-associated protein
MTAGLRENSHQGFEGIKAAHCLARLKAKSNIASGMPACLRPDGTGSRCSGKERDAESGLDYFGARYYSGAQGRFTSPDEFKGGVVDPFTGGQVEPPGPLPYADVNNPQSLNKYVYVLNNPLRYTDPDGHDIVYRKGVAPPTDSEELRVLQSIDEQNGPKDVIVLSGYRDPERNAAAGGARDSWHVKGMAADITVPGQTPEQTAAQSVKAGAEGVSTYDKSKGTPRVHVDVRQKEWNGINGRTAKQRPDWRTNPDKVLGIDKPKPATTAPTQPSFWQWLKKKVQENIP